MKWTISCDYCGKTVERDCEPADVTDYFHQSIWPVERKITAVCCDCMAWHLQDPDLEARDEQK